MLLALVLLSACAVQPGGSTSIESLSDVSSVADNSTVDKGYSFSDVDSLYGPDAFSVNELSEIFGEPTFLGGYRFQGGAFALNVRFEDIMFDLVANNGEQLNYIIKDDSMSPSGFGRYAITESDRSVRMKPLCSWVSGENWPLPRNMKIGDSRDKLTGAYNGDEGLENTAEGQLSVSYDYGQSGYISYIFYNDKLESVSITWYDAEVLG